jgi:hypothetical protein
VGNGQHAYVTSLKRSKKRRKFQIYFSIIQRFNELTSLHVAPGIPGKILFYEMLIYTYIGIVSRRNIFLL